MWEEVRGRRSVPRKEWTERAWLCTSNRFQELAETDGEIDPVYVEDSVPSETGGTSRAGVRAPWRPRQGGRHKTAVPGLPGIVGSRVAWPVTDEDADAGASRRQLRVRLLKSRPAFAGLPGTLDSRILCRVDEGVEKEATWIHVDAQTRRRVASTSHDFPSLAEAFGASGSLDTSTRAQAHASREASRWSRPSMAARAPQPRASSPASPAVLAPQSGPAVGSRTVLQTSRIVASVPPPPSPHGTGRLMH